MRLYWAHVFVQQQLGGSELCTGHLFSFLLQITCTLCCFQAFEMISFGNKILHGMRKPEFPYLDCLLTSLAV